MLTTTDFLNMKKNQEKMTMITAYDYPSAKLAEEAGIDMILVGDSLGMVVLGLDSTIEVTVDDMIHHAQAVKRGAKNTFTLVDMPFMSYHISLEESLKNAKKLFQQTNAQALKIEGSSKENMILTKRLTEAGIPVVGHLGLTPQLVNVLGGYKVQGKDQKAQAKLLEDAKQLQSHGAILIVLEAIPMELAKIVTDSLYIPTIGIGAGVDCDGQVLVYHDILQYGVNRLPKFVRPYSDFNQHGRKAIQQYIQDVKKGLFPNEEHSYQMKNKNMLPQNE